MPRKKPLAAPADPVRGPSRPFFPHRHMSLDLEQIRRIARLARIAVSDAEAADTAVRLNGLLGLIEQMQAVDTSGIEPMAHALDAQMSIAQRLREDKAVEPDRRAAYQECAPAVQDGLYLVPRVVE